jgi:hypothetical protein
MEIFCEDKRELKLTQDHAQCRAVVKAVMNVSVLVHTGKYSYIYFSIYLMHSIIIFWKILNIKKKRLLLKPYLLFTALQERCVKHIKQKFCKYLDNFNEA